MALSDHADNAELDLAVAIEIAFSDPVRLWSGLGARTFEGNEFTGAGSLLEMGEVGETSNIEATGITLALSGAPREMISLALGATYQNLATTVWLWIITDDGTIDGEIIYRGFADTMAIEEGGDNSKIQLSLESQLARLERAAVELYSQEDLERRHPGDRGLEFIEDLQDKNIVWGARGTADIRGRTTEK